MSVQPDSPVGKAIDTVAVVGCGVVGCGWVPVFLRMGCKVRLYDTNPARLDLAQALAREFSHRDPSGGAWKQGDLSVHHELAAAVDGAGYIQESIAEKLELKQSLFRDIDAVADPQAYIASSTSSLDINDIARDVVHPRRCFTAHPFNPASVIPVVELLGTVSSTAADLAGIKRFLEAAGQLPVVLNRFVPGYIGNRLQAAIMREALHLVTSGIADANGVDALVSHALALRWVPLGVFGTNHTNDEAGLKGYYERFWESYQSVMATLAATPPMLDEGRLDAINTAVNSRFDDAPVAEVARWRDDVVVELRRLQREKSFSHSPRDLLNP